MTIDSTVELSRDLSHHTDWPLFSNAGVAGREVALAACTLTWRKPGARPSDVIGPASAGLERLLTQLRASLGYGMHMLVVHATLQPKSAVLMHRGLWRMDVLKSMPAAIARGAEARIECDNKVRFAALARVPLAEIAWMVAKLSAFEAIIPLFLKSDVPMDETAASRLANAAFPPGGCADRSDPDWANFARHIVSIGGICARWSSDLSVPEVALDLFLAADAEAQRVRAILDEAH